MAYTPDDDSNKLVPYFGDIGNTIKGFFYADPTKDPTGYEAINLRQRMAIADAMRKKEGKITNVGEGISAAADSFARQGEMAQLDRMMQARENALAPYRQKLMGTDGPTVGATAAATAPPPFQGWGSVPNPWRTAEDDDPNDPRYFA